MSLTHVLTYILASEAFANKYIVVDEIQKYNPNMYVDRMYSASIEL